MKKEKVCVGDTIVVDVCQPKFGKFPIGRFSRIICKLTYPDGLKRLEYGCVITATVLVIKDKLLSVLVEEVIKSAAAAYAADAAADAKQKSYSEKLKDILISFASSK